MTLAPQTSPPCNARAKSARIGLAAAGIAALMLVSAVIADALGPDGPELSWTTIDAGGGQATALTADGAYDLTGTIGQPEALNTGRLSGGAITFTPGFWNDHAVGPTPNCLSDVAPAPIGDGFVNVDDLLLVITTWGVPHGAGDATRDGVVNVDDLLAVIIHWGACPPD